MSPTAKLNTLHALLAQYRFNYSSEADLQDGIEKVLVSCGYRVEREFRLSFMHRLDFLIDQEIAIETKIGGSANQLIRQVSYYAQYEKVAAILAVTDRATHTLPPSFNGKPVLVHSLMDGAF